MRRTRAPRLAPRPGADAARARRNRVLFVLLACVILAMVWISAVILLGGEEQGSSPDDASGDGRQQQRESGAERGSSQRPSERSGEGEGQAEGQAEGQDPSGADPIEAEDISESVGPPPGGGVPAGEVAIEDEEGRTNGQHGFVSEFVSRAYGYTGSDVDTYLSGVAGRVDRDSYLSSPAGEEIERYAQVVGSGGAENATVMDDYRIKAGPAVDKALPDDRVEDLLTPEASRAVSENYTEEELAGASLATVKYAIGDRYGDPENEDEEFGEVYGDVEYYAQDLLLVGGGSAEPGGEASGITILAGSAPRQIEDPDADLPPPGAPKVGYEPPGGHEHGPHGQDPRAGEHHGEHHGAS